MSSSSIHTKPKFQEKPRPPVYFNFDFDPEKISIKTEIPSLPEKFMSKPDQKLFNRKIKQLQQKLQELKQQRQKKKAEYSKFGSGYEQQVKKIQENILLGNKCIKVLESDLLEIENNAAQLDGKIQKKLGYMRKLKRGSTKDLATSSEKKEYEDMTYEELDSIIEKLSIRVSTANLTKKEETEINSQVSKLNRFKLKAPHGSPLKQNNDYQIQNSQQALEKLKQIKKKQDSKIASIKYKIQCIKQDIEAFDDLQEELEEKRKDPEVIELKEQTQGIKQQIYELREQISELKQAFLNKQTDYEYQIKKIQWIKFATEIKENRLSEWEEEKAERRRKKFKQTQNKQKGTQQKKQGQQKQTESTRQKINRNQKQIDVCTFLITYCEQLRPKQQGSSNLTKSQLPVDQANIQNAIKKGEWAQEKGIQILKSKKQIESQPQQKINKKNKKSKKVIQKQEDNNTILKHQVFTENIFDSVKVVPPSKQEQIDKTIQIIKDKLDYYLEHPQGTGEYKKNPENNKDRQIYAADKYKGRNNQNRKIINTEDFPALR